MPYSDTITEFFSSCISSLQADGRSTETLAVLKKIIFLSPHQCQSTSHDIVAVRPDELPADVMNQARLELRRKHYTGLLRILLQSQSWKTSDTNPNVDSYINALVLECFPTQSFATLILLIQELDEGYRLDCCCALLEKIILNDKLTDIIWEQCMMFTEKDEDIPWANLILLLSSVPSRLANKFQRHVKEVFLPATYVKALGKALLDSVEKAHASIQNKQETSVKFIHQLLSQLVLHQDSDELLSCIIPTLEQRCCNNFVYRLICQNIFKNLADKSLDTILPSLLKYVKWYKGLHWLIGDVIKTNKRFDYLITHKLLVIRYFSDINIVRHLIGYVSVVSRDHLMNVTSQLLSVWGDATHLKHTSYAQHLYISGAIMVCVSHCKLTDSGSSSSSSDAVGGRFNKLFLDGVSAHLSSSNVRVRCVGMVVAESLAQVCHNTGSTDELKFEYDDNDDDVKVLKGLLVLPGDSSYNDENIAQSESVSDEPGKDVADATSQPVPSSSTGDDIDSDDDIDNGFLPYDLSNDTKHKKVQEPAYLKDCIEGLLCTDNAEKFEAAFGVAHKLICRNSSVLHLGDGVELLHILLHLGDTYSTAGFDRTRLALMTEVCARCPAVGARYLTAEFYGENYSVAQRLNMLHVLGAAAREIASPHRVDTDRQSKVVEVSGPGSSSGSVIGCGAEERGSGEEVRSSGDEDWTQIVERRIESKTRRFGMAALKQKKMGDPGVKNQFHQVAGDFFFPLLKKYDIKVRTMDLFDDDYIVVLARLISTLGMLIHCAENCGAVLYEMCKAMLEFIWCSRYQADIEVQKALLFATLAVFITLPPYQLVSDEIRDYVTECRMWLEGIIERGSHVECRKMALDCMALLHRAVRDNMAADMQPVQQHHDLTA